MSERQARLLYVSQIHNDLSRPIRIKEISVSREFLSSFLIYTISEGKLLSTPSYHASGKFQGGDGGEKGQDDRLEHSWSYSKAGSVSNPQFISTNLTSNVEGDLQEDIEQRCKKNTSANGYFRSSTGRFGSLTKVHGSYDFWKLLHVILILSLGIVLYTQAYSNKDVVSTAHQIQRLCWESNCSFFSCFPLCNLRRLFLRYALRLCRASGCPTACNVPFWF